MNDRLSLSRFFSFGLAVSLSWHFAWTFVFVPVRTDIIYRSIRCQSFFLGPVLRDADLAVSVPVRPSDRFFVIGRKDDHSRETYFEKISLLFHKPKSVYESVSPQSPQAVLESRGDVSSEPVAKITASLSDLGQYMGNIDLSEVRGLVSRGDLAGAVDFKVFLASDGRVEVVRGMGSSGDPAVDLAIMRQFKQAVFKGAFKKEGWIGVHLKLK